MLHTSFWSSQHYLVSWAKSYVCSVNPANLVHLWFEASLAIWYHMFMCFLLLDLWLIIKRNLETNLWNDISHRTLRSNSYGKMKVFDREGWNDISYDILVFRLLFLFSLINQRSGYENNINTWHQEPHFIQNKKLTLQALILQTYGFTPLTRWHYNLQKDILQPLTTLEWL